MVNCSVLNCKNRSVKGGSVRFFTIPKEEKFANAWLQYCRPSTNRRTGVVCSVHFVPSDYHTPLRHILMNVSPRTFRNLKTDAIPSLNLNSVAQPSTCDNPVLDRSSETVTMCVEPDLYLPEGEDLNNSSETVATDSAQTQPIGNRCVGTQTLDSTNTVAIPISEYKELMSIKNKYTVINKKLKQIFTPGQIRSLVRTDKRRVRWSADDIASANTLRSTNPEGYQYMRNVIGIPLPGYSTICKWIAKSETENGSKKLNNSNAIQDIEPLNTSDQDSSAISQLDESVA